MRSAVRAAAVVAGKGESVGARIDDGRLISPRRADFDFREVVHVLRSAFDVEELLEVICACAGCQKENQEEGHEL